MILNISLFFGGKKENKSSPSDKNVLREDSHYNLLQIE